MTDLDVLEAVARAALVPGDGEADANQQLVGNTAAFSAWLKANGDYHQAADPATVLDLISAARECDAMREENEKLRAAISWLGPQFIDDQSTLTEIRKRIAFMHADAARARQALNQEQPA